MYQIEVSELFEKQAKKLIKKYPSLAIELLTLQTQLAENPFMGVALGNDIYKIRLAVKSKGKGKSGGLRIIDYVFKSNETIYLLSIYDKSDVSSISIETIKSYVAEIMESFGLNDKKDDKKG